jgi:hypothetical protein
VKSNEEKTRELIGQHLTKNVVSQMRTSAAIKTAAGFIPSKLIGVLKIDIQGHAYWSVEQRFGFPFQEIHDRDVRRVVWEALEKQDEEDRLRLVIIDQQHNFAASIHIPYSAERGDA